VPTSFAARMLGGSQIVQNRKCANIAGSARIILGLAGRQLQARGSKRPNGGLIAVAVPPRPARLHSGRINGPRPRSRHPPASSSRRKFQESWSRW